jgi:hypothetical protein
MRIARPPTGFVISCTATVDALVRAECEAHPAFERHWGDLLERLKFTAHREGKSEPRLGNGFRLLAVAADGFEDRPRIVVGYLVLGDAVRITLLRVSR